MIAKSKLAAVLLGIFFCTQTLATIDNKYERILKEYDIHPPELKYGYPLWYQYDSLPVTGVIFLEESLDSVVWDKENVVIAQPSPDFAVQIRDGLPLYGTGVYFVIADEDLPWQKIDSFLMELVYECADLRAYLVGSNSLYFPVEYDDLNTCAPNICPPHFHPRDLFKLEKLTGGFYKTSLDSGEVSEGELSGLFYDFYAANRNGFENDRRFPLYEMFSQSYFNAEEAYYLNYEFPESMRSIDSFAVLKYQQRKTLFHQIGTYRLISWPASIRITGDYEGFSASDYFRVLNIVGAVLVKLRNETCRDLGRGDYDLNKLGNNRRDEEILRVLTPALLKTYFFERPIYSRDFREEEEEIPVPIDFELFAF